MNSKPDLILVTGSAGYLGSAIVRRLSSKYRVVGLDQKPPQTVAEGTEFLRCDLTDDASVGQAMAGIRERHGGVLASCIHLAAYYDFSGEPSPLYRTLTVEGTRRLLRQVRQFQAGQFVFSSTLLVMQPAEEEDEVISESSPTEPAWDYPRSKLLAEGEIRRERENVPAVILRIAGVYDEDCHSIPLAQQIARIYEKKLESYFCPGDPSRGQPFVHLEDLVDCVERVVEKRDVLTGYEVFLIAEPEVSSYDELQNIIGELLYGREWPTIRIPKAVAKAGAWAQEKLAGPDETFIKPWMIDLADQHYPVAIERACARLGWFPRHRLRNTLAEMIARLKRDPHGWYQRNGLEPPEDLERQKNTAA
jgi:nucleoside-diphosphate-sugar epimerase